MTLPKNKILHDFSWCHALHQKIDEFSGVLEGHPISLVVSAWWKEQFTRNIRNEIQLPLSSPDHVASQTITPNEFERDMKGGDLNRCPTPKSGSMRQHVHQEFQVPKTENFLKLMFGYFGGVSFPWSRIQHSLQQRWGFLHVRYLKCLVTHVRNPYLEDWNETYIPVGTAWKTAAWDDMILGKNRWSPYILIGDELHAF